MDLAQERLNPAFLRLHDPVEEASVEVSAGAFLVWLDVHPEWATPFYANLQSLAQTAAGEPLLTTWLPSAQFWGLLHEGRGTTIIDEILGRVRGWELLGLDEIFFDLYVIGPRTENVKNEAIADPVAA